MPYFGAATYFSYQTTLRVAEGGLDRDAAGPAATNRIAESRLLCDPWDAPYFGEAVYLSYSPTLPDCPVPPVLALLGADAMVSLPLSLQPTPAQSGGAIENRAGEQMLVTSGPAGHRKRTWWTRLFGHS